VFLAIKCKPYFSTRSISNSAQLLAAQKAPEISGSTAAELQKTMRTNSAADAGYVSSRLLPLLIFATIAKRRRNGGRFKPVSPLSGLPWLDVRVSGVDTGQA
jgi:hypothetical protein